MVLVKEKKTPSNLSVINWPIFHSFQECKDALDQFLVPKSNAEYNKINEYYLNTLEFLKTHPKYASDIVKKQSKKKTKRKRKPKS